MASGTLAATAPQARTTRHGALTDMEQSGDRTSSRNVKLKQWVYTPCRQDCLPPLVVQPIDSATDMPAEATPFDHFGRPFRALDYLD